MLNIDPQAPRSVTSFCCVVVWQAPSRAYGVITGYDVRLFNSLAEDGLTDSEGVVILKNRDEFFHAVVEEDFPVGSGDSEETLVQVSQDLYGCHDIVCT